MAGEVDYSAVLADLKARRDALDQAIAAIEQLVGEGFLSPQTATGASQIHRDTFVGMNIADAAVRYLKMVGRPARSTDEITEALKRGGLDVSRDSVGTLLLRAYNQTESIYRVGRGLWGLPEWYPGRPKRAKRGAAEEEGGVEGAETPEEQTAG